MLPGPSLTQGKRHGVLAAVQALVPEVCQLKEEFSKKGLSSFPNVPPSDAEPQVPREIGFVDSTFTLLLSHQPFPLPTKPSFPSITMAYILPNVLGL